VLQRKAEYICADHPVNFHFSLATRRRTIHFGLLVIGELI